MLLKVSRPGSGSYGVLNKAGSLLMCFQSLPRKLLGHRLFLLCAESDAWFNAGFAPWTTLWNLSPQLRRYTLPFLPDHQLNGVPVCMPLASHKILAENSMHSMLGVCLLLWSEFVRYLATHFYFCALTQPSLACVSARDCGLNVVRRLLPCARKQSAALGLGTVSTWRSAVNLLRCIGTLHVSSVCVYVCVDVLIFVVMLTRCIPANRGQVCVLAYVTAFLETFSISAFPYYTFDDRQLVYTVGYQLQAVRD